MDPTETADRRLALLLKRLAVTASSTTPRSRVLELFAVDLQSVGFTNPPMTPDERRNINTVAEWLMDASQAMAAEESTP